MKRLLPGMLCVTDDYIGLWAEGYQANRITNLETNTFVVVLAAETTTLEVREYILVLTQFGVGEVDSSRLKVLK